VTGGPIPGDLARWLRLVVEPGSVVELRILECVDNPKYGSFTVAGYFDPEHLDELAKAAMTWTRKAAGCYLTINSVDPSLLARAANRIVKRPRQTTTDADVERRSGLVFDADPLRAGGISATEEEKALARETIDRLVSYLAALRWPDPILVDSGNGFHARYRIDLPPGDGGLVERVLKAAAARFSDDRVKIDTALFNPARIIKLPGTAARKGDDRPDRPHRWARVLSIPAEFRVVPVELLEALTAEAQASDPSLAIRGNRQAESGSHPSITAILGGATPEARARAYVFAPGFPDSIEGQRGHDALFRVACVLVDGFGLSFDRGLPLLQEWNQTKAYPPESDKQLRHKLDDAIKKHPAPSRSLLNSSRNGALTGTAAAAPPTDPPPWPPLRFSEPPGALPFPVDVFPEPLQAFCRELAEATLVPEDFVGLSMLVTAGAAIGQSVNIRVKRPWNEAPLLFANIVAPPGKAKSPVIRAVVSPLTEIDRRLRDESKKAHEAWQEAKKAHHDDPDSNPPPGPEPPQRRAIVKDITREALVRILDDNPRGVLCDPDEAAGWVASFNQYKGKGGSDRQFWLSIHTSEPVACDRKGGREEIHVPFPFVSVLGGLPPDMITSLRDDRGRSDGFLDRILFSYPDSFPPQSWTEKELSIFAEITWSKVISLLFHVPMQVTDERLRPLLVTFTPEAKSLFVEWFNDHAAEMESEDLPERQAGAWSKLRMHAARFALILAGMRLACDACLPTQHSSTPWTESINDKSSPPPIVNATDVTGARKLVDYFKSHLVRIAHRMTAGMGSADAKSVVHWIKRNRLNTFREAEVREDLRRFRDHPKDLAAALVTLEALGAIRPKREPSDPSKRGPKFSPAYEVHPDLLGAPDNSADSVISPPEPISGIGGIIGRSQESASGEISEREVFEV
jgi:hypothetical protein